MFGLFLVRYPALRDLSDGYFVRVKEVDEIVGDFRRVYVATDSALGFLPRLRRPASRVLEITLNPSSKFHFALLLAACFLAKFIYVHSVLRMEHRAFREAYKRAWAFKVFDVHGVVPEEFRLHDDEISAGIFEGIERDLIRESDAVICVTDAMKNHLFLKYPLESKGPVWITMPVIPPETGKGEVKASKERFVYVGGTQKWQNVPEIIEAVKSSALDKAKVLICSPDTGAFASLVPLGVEVKTAARQELPRIYESARYGFLVRDDIVVNRVSSPTKLQEYLAYDVIPIVKSPRIGDFYEQGYRFVSLENIDDLPSDDMVGEMLATNRQVIQRLRSSFEDGARKLIGSLKHE